MPYGGNDWLGLTQEEVLEPELPICDPHHHLWDQRPERIPYQRYLLPELLADVNQGHNVRSTVFIETRVFYRRSGPVEMRPVGQVEFVQRNWVHNPNFGTPGWARIRSSRRLRRAGSRCRRRERKGPT